MPFEECERIINSLNGLCVDVLKEIDSNGYKVSPELEARLRRVAMKGPQIFDARIQ
jgi:hypothetical protein